MKGQLVIAVALPGLMILDVRWLLYISTIFRWINSSTFFYRRQHFKLFTQQTQFYQLWLRSFASLDSPSIFSTINPCRPCGLITRANFPTDQGGLPHTLSLKRSRWPPFFACLLQVTHTTAVKFKTKPIDCKIFARTSLTEQTQDKREVWFKFCSFAVVS